MAPFIAVIFLEAFCASSFYRLGPVRVNDIGGDAAMLGLGATLAAYVEVPFMISSSRLLKRVGLRRRLKLGSYSGNSGVAMRPSRHCGARWRSSRIILKPGVCWRIT
jgi:hypothetical protein